MKYISTFFLLVGIFFSPIFFFAQPLYLKKIYPAPSASLHSNFLLPQPDNSVLDFGVIDSKSIITKIDSTGNLIWTKSYLFNTNINIRSNFIDGTNDYDSSFAIVGTLLGATPGATAYCVKLRPNGDTLWCRKIVNPNLVSILPFSINQTIDSGFVICGRASSSSTVSGPTQHAFVAKLTKSGNLSWFKKMTTNFYSSEAYSIKQTADSGYIFIGGIGYGGDWCSSLTKLDKLGNFSWQNTYCETPVLGNDASGIDLVVENNGYLCLLTTNSSNNSAFLKTDLTGNIIWTKKYNAPSYFNPPYIKLMNLKKISENKLLVTYKDAVSSGWNMVIDTAGNIQWGSVTYLTGIDMVMCKNKNFMLVGNPSNMVVKTSSALFPTYGIIGVIVTDSLGLGYGTCYMSYNLTKSSNSLITTSYSSTLTNAGTLSSIQPTLGIINLIDSMGCIALPTGINQNKNEHTSINIYPNPSEGKLTLQFEALHEKPIIFKLYDVTGRTLIIKQFILEKNSANIDLTELNSGIYLYSLSSDSKILKKDKIIISN